MRFVVLLLAVISFTGTAHAQAESKPEWLFGQRQGVSDISLSPDGKQIVFVAPDAGRGTNVYYVDLNEKKPRLVTRSSGNPEQVVGCGFVSNSRLACTIYAVGESGGIKLSYSERVALDLDGKNMKPLGQKRSYYSTGLRQYDGYVLDWLPESNDVLMVWQFVPEVNVSSKINRKAEGLGVVKLDTRTGRWKGVESAKRNASDFLSDGEGNIRILGFDAMAADSTLTNYFYRKPGSSKQYELGSYDYANRKGFRPIAVDGQDNLVYGLELHNGRLALFSITLDDNKTKSMVFSHPRVDISGVKRFGSARRVVGVRYSDEYNHTRYFDKSLEALAQQLSSALPGKPGLQFVDSSSDENVLLLYAGSDRDPGRYYIFDRSQKRLEELMLERPQLENVSLAAVKPVSYTTPDGTTVPGYLTLPPGKEAKMLPTVVMPHGGPSSRDVWGFDWLAQYFVNRGYAVLQPNFRGSYGYGQRWFQVNGFQQWDTAIGDVSAGAQWLISEGIADPEKMAIVGWSYGGYAALQSGVAYPDLYKAIVAIAPVTDLRTLIDNSRNYTSFSRVLDYVGSGPHIVAGSPARNASRIKAPVMMFHGDMDLNVDVMHSRKMDSALRDAGKVSRYFEYNGLDHGLPDSTIRSKMLGEAGEFLDQHLNK